MPAATVTIKNAGDMTPKERKTIAEWLHEQADTLILEGTDYAKTYRATYG